MKTINPKGFLSTLLMFFGLLFCNVAQAQGTTTLGAPVNLSVSQINESTDFHIPENPESEVECLDSATLSWDNVSAASHYLVEMCEQYESFSSSAGSAWARNICGEIVITLEGNILKIGGVGGGGQDMIAGIAGPEIYENLGGSTVILQFTTTNSGGNNNRFALVANTHTLDRSNCSTASITGSMIAAVQISTNGGTSLYTSNNPQTPMPGTIANIASAGTAHQYELTVTLPTNNAALNMQLPYGASPTDVPYSTFGFAFQNLIDVYFTGISIETASGAYYAWGENYVSGGGEDTVLQGINCACFPSRQITANPDDVFATTLQSLGYSINTGSSTDVNLHFNDTNVSWSELGTTGRVALALNNTFLQPDKEYFWRVLALGDGVEPILTGQISDWSDVQSFQTQAPGDIPAPSVSEICTTATTATLEITDYNPESTYTVELCSATNTHDCYNADVVPSTDGTTGTINVTGLPMDTYNYTVTEKNYCATAASEGFVTLVPALENITVKWTTELPTLNNLATSSNTGSIEITSERSAIPAFGSLTTIETYYTLRQDACNISSVTLDGTQLPYYYQYVNDVSEYPFNGIILITDNNGNVVGTYALTVNKPDETETTDITEPEEHHLIHVDCYTVTGIKIDCESVQSVHGILIKDEIYDDGTLRETEKYVK